VTWDPRVELQFSGLASRTWKGENTLNEPFVPGTPVPPVNELEGVPLVTDDFTGTVRWWLATGADFSLSLGWVHSRRDNGLIGSDSSGGHMRFAFRLTQ